MPFEETKKEGRLIASVEENLMHGRMTRSRQFETVSESAQDLVTALLNVDEKTRLNMKDVLVHDWFQVSVGVKNLIIKIKKIKIKN